MLAEVIHAAHERARVAQELWSVCSVDEYVSLWRRRAWQGPHGKRGYKGGCRGRWHDRLIVWFVKAGHELRHELVAGDAGRGAEAGDSRDVATSLGGNGAARSQQLLPRHGAPCGGNALSCVMCGDARQAADDTCAGFGKQALRNLVTIQGLDTAVAYAVPCCARHMCLSAPGSTEALCACCGSTQSASSHG